MNVSDAVMKRKSTRAFTDQSVDTSIIQKCLQTAARAPSGGNVQPWKVCVLNDEPMQDFKTLMKKRMAGEAYPGGEKPEYSVYPDKLKEPYRTARFEVGEDMYQLLSISRDDKSKRLEWFARNYQFFDAPAGIFCFMDRVMGPPQWSDLGMFLQSFMLLLEEAGLQSCAQECWSQFPKTVSDFCNMSDQDMLFCGMAIGYGDKNHPVNQLKTKRLQEDQWLKIV